MRKNVDEYFFDRSIFPDYASLKCINGVPESKIIFREKAS